MKHYDILIIGAGPGGYVSAEEAAKCGKEPLLKLSTTLVICMLSLIMPALPQQHR